MCAHKHMCHLEEMFVLLDERQPMPLIVMSPLSTVLPGKDLCPFLSSVQGQPPVLGQAAVKVWTNDPGSATSGPSGSGKVSNTETVFSSAK